MRAQLRQAPAAVAEPLAELLLRGRASHSAAACREASAALACATGAPAADTGGVIYCRRTTSDPINLGTLVTASRKVFTVRVYALGAMDLSVQVKVNF